MSFSASFNGRPLVTVTRKNAYRNAKVVKSNFPISTPGYYNVLRTARGNADAFAKALTMISKGR